MLTGSSLMGRGSDLWAETPEVPVSVRETSQASTGSDSSAGFSVAEVETGTLDPALLADGWVLLQKRGVAPTVFRSDDSDTIRIVSDRSNALIYRSVAGTQSSQSFLSWEWRLDEVKHRDEASAAANPDWPIVIYAAFEVDRQYVGWWRRLVNRIVAGVAGLPESGNILTYLYSLDSVDAHGPLGQFTPNPYIPKIGMMMPLRAGYSQARDELNVWHRERRDLMIDFEAAFGYPAARVLYIAISADSEDTESMSIARVRGLRLE